LLPFWSYFQYPARSLSAATKHYSAAEFAELRQAAERIVNPRVAQDGGVSAPYDAITAEMRLE
jgi:hypothetical protein